MAANMNEFRESSPPSAEATTNGIDYPSTPSPSTSHHNRYSAFDTHLFALSHPSSSPSQAIKTLEARLLETDRRIQEASRLGTSLVTQRQDLSNKLREVAAQADDGKIGHELRQKLVNIEEEYNELGRHSAKVFLGPKSEQSRRDVSGPFALDGRNPSSPTKFSSQAIDSPSKMNVPRKQRNAAMSNDHIEFATEITTSLLDQVRHLQALLADRDDLLKSTSEEKLRLEADTQSLAQRLKSVDDSEQRYKDECWNLETQVQEMQAQHREALSREHRLQQSMSAAAKDQAHYEREYDDLKQNHAKLSDEHTALRKHYDGELSLLRRNLASGENETSTIQRKLDEVTMQNEHLASALAERSKLHNESRMASAENGLDQSVLDDADLELSPPPSPTKGNPRHTMLESETLKSSLHHAHRMIQSLKNNIHKEKAEKLDLKRMLQDARDELESAESHEKRGKSKSQPNGRKGSKAGLGAARDSRVEVELQAVDQESEWEDHNEGSHNGLTKSAPKSIANVSFGVSRVTTSANETEDSAFETANERDTTDNDAFQTGAESLADDSSDDLTETEAENKRSGASYLKNSPLTTSIKHRNRNSMQSTASSSDDETKRDLQTPLQTQTQRFRLKMNRHSKPASIATSSVASSTAKNSPASFMTQDGQGHGQSLFAELENVSEPEADTTPSMSIRTQRSSRSMRRDASAQKSSIGSRKSISSQPGTPRLASHSLHTGTPTPAVPYLRPTTADAGTMTEEWTLPTDQGSMSDSVAAHAHPDQLSSATALTSTSKDTGLRMISGSTAPATPPQGHLWDHALDHDGSLVSIQKSNDTTPMSISSTQLGGMLQQEGLEPTIEKAGSTPQVQLSMSSIYAVETMPVSRKPHEHMSTDANEPGSTAGQSVTTTAASSDGTSTGFFGSILSWKRENRDSVGRQIAARGRDDKPLSSEVEDQESRLISNPGDPGNAECHDAAAENEASTDQAPIQGRTIESIDEASQTSLSSAQIEQLLSQKASVIPNHVAMHKSDSSPTTMGKKADHGTRSIAPTTSGVREPHVDQINGSGPEVRVPEGAAASSLQSAAAVATKPAKRTINSNTTRAKPSHYPPLPVDHQEAIAAATSQNQNAEPLMGPPPLPAPNQAPHQAPHQGRVGRSRAGSRPQTPSQQAMSTASPASKLGTTPRAGRYSSVRSHASRRSSVSSFASELDERFNIRADTMMGSGQGFMPGTDPRMIQAITQTMIGELMWKYTRKTGRGEMSSTRHPRYFWVHPYTRTLYWSERDPTAVNRAELKSKSVAIEAVRVVTDDNPMPPGLHRKSLVIVTPGRSVKITAQTSQRHETWFNALSYLLLRNGSDDNEIGTGNSNEANDAEIREFDPSSGMPGSRSRMSFGGRAGRNSAARHEGLSLSNHARSGPGTATQQNRGDHSAHDGSTIWDSQSGSIRRRLSQSFSRGRLAPRRETATISSPTRPQSRPSEFSTSSTSALPVPHQTSVGSRVSSMFRPPQSLRGSVRSRQSIRDGGAFADANAPNSAASGAGNGRLISGPSVDSVEEIRHALESRDRENGLENVRSCCNGRHDVGQLHKDSRHTHHRSMASMSSRRSASSAMLGHPS